MPLRRLISPIALAAALCLAPGARAFDDAKYPDWKGQWTRTGGVQWDDTKLPGRGQRAPLTAEYAAVLEESLADQKQGGVGNEHMIGCTPPGMPRTMTAIGGMEIIILPETTYIAISQFGQVRRVYTDGRDWPADVKPSFLGYSLGRWLDEDKDGRYDVLEIETRNMRGPRSFEESGLPLHSDNQTIVKERIFLDPYQRDILHDEITTIDHALTRPWTVTKLYQRQRHRLLHPKWYEYVCAEDNQHILLGKDRKDHYYLSADGYLMPAQKDQKPPDLKYFQRAQPQ